MGCEGVSWGSETPWRYQEAWIAEYPRGKHVKRPQPYHLITNHPTHLKTGHTTSTMAGRRNRTQAVPQDHRYKPLLVGWD
jgi:hypothetical protein